MGKCNFTRYRDNYLMADQDTGQGNVNNRTLSGLMENIAKGCKDWGGCIKNENGLILPDDPSFLVGEYIHRLGSKSDK